MLPKEDRDGKDEKRVNKAGVLIRAKKQILDLEMEEKALEDEKLSLEGVVKELKGRWAKLGGICVL
jgi:hypothetical protein